MQESPGSNSCKVFEEPSGNKEKSIISTISVISSRLIICGKGALFFRFVEGGWGGGIIIMSNWSCCSFAARTSSRVNQAARTTQHATVEFCELLHEFTLSQGLSLVIVTDMLSFHHAQQHCNTTLWHTQELCSKTQTKTWRFAQTLNQAWLSIQFGKILTAHCCAMVCHQFFQS